MKQPSPCRDAQFSSGQVKLGYGSCVVEELPQLPGPWRTAGWLPRDTGNSFTSLVMLIGSYQV